MASGVAEEEHEEVYQDEDNSFNEDVEKLKVVIQNEKSSPEILPYLGEVVVDLKELVDKQEEQVEEFTSDGATEFFNASLYQMEIDRIKFMLATYLRTRLFKIQQCPHHLMSSAEFYDNLSDDEYEFARDYCDKVDSHFKSVLAQLPEPLQALGETDGVGMSMVQAPDLDKYVFCRVNKDLGEVEVNADTGNALDEQTVELMQGDIYALRYRAVANLLQGGDIALI